MWMNHVFLQDVVQAPKFLSVDVAVRGDGVEECVVSVEWSYSTVSCEKTQYELLVGPPTPGYQSLGSEFCQYTTNMTRQNLTLAVEETYNLLIGVAQRQTPSTVQKAINSHSTLHSSYSCHASVTTIQALHHG